MISANLIRKAKCDPHAFAKLYNFQVLPTYRYIVFHCKSDKDAEDLTSEVWEIVLQKIAGLKSDHPFAFKAWLYVIIRNVLHQHFRKNSKTSTVAYEEQENFLVSPENTPNENMILKDELQQMKVLINGLPEKQQEIIVLRFASGLKNKEIAAMLDISEKTVASNCSRALDTLRKNWKNLQ